jgi:uncharacterized DUF497 family protein
MARIAGVRRLIASGGSAANAIGVRKHTKTLNPDGLMPQLTQVAGRPLQRAGVKFGFSVRRVTVPGPYGLDRPVSVYTAIVYTRPGMAEIEGFDWDAANVGHILRHANTPFELEEAVRGLHATIPARTVRREKRWKLFGKTASNRCLVVVFTIRHQRVRAVTAYEMNATGRGSVSRLPACPTQFSPPAPRPACAGRGPL